MALIAPRIFLIALAILLSHRSLADTQPVVVCYPGGPVSEDEANKAMNAMLGFIEKKGGWPSQTFTSFFSSDVTGCKNLLEEKQPAFAITSLGIFLSEEKALPIDPVVQPKMRGTTNEQFHLVAAKGRYTSLESAKGATVGGTVFDEGEFIRKIVFQGKLNPEQDFQLKPSRQAIRALRALDKGEIDAVLLNGQQFAALSSLNMKTSIESFYDSPEIPMMGLIANRSKASPEEQSRFKDALTGMCEDPDGRKLCDLFGIEAFVTADLNAIHAALAEWKKKH